MQEALLHFCVILQEGQSFRAKQTCIDTLLIQYRCKELELVEVQVVLLTLLYIQVQSSETPAIDWYS